MLKTLFSEVGLLFLFGLLVSPVLTEIVKRKLKLVDNGALVLSLALAVIFGFLAVVRAQYAGADQCRENQLTVLHVVFDSVIVFGLATGIFKTILTWLNNRLTSLRKRGR